MNYVFKKTNERKFTGVVQDEKVNVIIDEEKKKRTAKKIYNDVIGDWVSVLSIVRVVSSSSTETQTLVIIGRSPWVVSLSLVLCVEYFG
jgi:hypothetical protein